MTRARTLRWLLPLLALAFVAVGCGSDSANTGPDSGFTFADTPHVSGQDIQAPEDIHVAPKELPDFGGPVDHEREIMFLHDTSRDVEVPVQGQRKFQIRVIDYTAGGPAADTLVSFRLVAHDGGDGRTSSRQALTGDDGMAELSFYAETLAPASYTLFAVAEGAEEVGAGIDVVDQPRGAIRVALTYDGALPLREIRVRVMPAGTFQCNHFSAVSPPADFTDEKLVPTLSGTALFEDQVAEKRYVVFATAKGPRGNLVAGGCADGIYVAASEETLATVALHTLVLNPAGNYDMIAVFDFTGAIPGQVGEIINHVVNAFSAPGIFISDMVSLVVDLYLGQLVGGVVETILGWFEDDLNDLLWNWINTSAPQWVQDIFTIGQDLTQIVANLELIANLNIAKLSSDYVVQGQEDWVGLALYWHLGCVEEGEPGYDPNCGRIELSLEQIEDTEFPLTLVQGKWTGTITNFDQLNLDRHQIQLNYGRLIIFVLNEIILPNVGGAPCDVAEDCGGSSYCYEGECEYHSLLDAALGFVNCRSIADGLVGDLLDGLGVDRDEVAGFCNNALSTIVGPLVLTVYSLGADSSLRLYGTARLVDDDDNLTVDRIVDGIFYGFIELGTGESGSTFEAVWRADR